LVTSGGIEDPARFGKPEKGERPIGWKMLLQRINAKTAPLSALDIYTYARASGLAPGDFPVVEVEALSLKADAPARNLKASPSQEFKTWVVKDIGGATDGFEKPTDKDLQAAGVASDLALESLTCATYARRGYNVLYMDLMNLAENGLALKNKPLFKPVANSAGNYYQRGDDYRIPRDLLMDGGGNTLSSQSKMAAYFGSTELQEGFSGSVKIEGGSSKIPGAGRLYSGKAELRASYDQTLVNSEKTVTVVREKFGYDFWLILNKKRATLHDTLVARLKTVALGSPKDVTAFYEEYGTHYPLAQLFGGRAEEHTRITEQGASTAIKKSLGATVGVDTPLAEGEVSLDVRSGFSKSVDWSKENTTVNFTGSAGTDFASWSLPPVKDYVPLKAYLRPIGEIVHPELADSITEADALLLHRARVLLTRSLDKYLNGEFSQLTPIASSTKRPMCFQVTIDSIKKEVGEGNPGITLVADLDDPRAMKTKQRKYFQKDQSADDTEYEKGKIYTPPLKGGLLFMVENVEHPDNLEINIDTAAYVERDDAKKPVFGGMSFGTYTIPLKAAVKNVLSSLNSTYQVKDVRFGTSDTAQSVDESKAKLGGVYVYKITISIKKVGIVSSRDELPRLNLLEP
jgi:hypothetical protein